MLSCFSVTAGNTFLGKDKGGILTNWKSYVQNKGNYVKA